ESARARRAARADLAAAPARAGRLHRAQHGAPGRGRSARGDRRDCRGDWPARGRPGTVRRRTAAGRAAVGAGRRRSMTNFRRTSSAGRARLGRGQITRGETTTRIAWTFALACAALALAGAAQGALSIGVSEDRGRDDPTAFFASLTDVGLSQNRISIFWDPANPNVISGKTALEAWLPMAQTA